jgi:DNA-binding transcriptional ArsR family regulator
MVKYDVLDRTFSLGPASVSELAALARISLPGVLKHVRILEEARLVTTEKKGRTRECRLGPDQMDDITRWIESHREVWERRLDRLEAVVQKRKGERR